MKQGLQATDMQLCPPVACTHMRFMQRLGVRSSSANGLSSLSKQQEHPSKGVHTWFCVMLPMLHQIFQHDLVGATSKALLLAWIQDPKSTTSSAKT